MSTILDWRYNAMLHARPWLFKRSRIAHFVASLGQGKTLLDHLVDCVDQHGRVCPERNGPCRERRTPLGSGRRAVAALVLAALRPGSCQEDSTGSDFASWQPGAIHHLMHAPS